MKCKNCGSLIFEVLCEGNKEIQRCKNCGQERVLRDFTQDRGFRYKTLNRYNLITYQPEGWCNHSLSVGNLGNDA